MTSLAESLALEFASDVLNEEIDAYDLFDWLCHHDKLGHETWSDLKKLGEEVDYIYSNQIILTLKEK